MTLTTGADEIVADGETEVLITAGVRDRTNAPISNATVTFDASFGTLLETEATTDTDGVAQVRLKAPSRTGLARITAATGGYIRAVDLQFVAGAPVDAKSAITVQPSSIPADGVSTATVTVTLADVNGNPVADGTAVSLFASLGSIVANEAETASGRAVFEIVASANQGLATLSLQDFPEITSTSVRFGSPGSGLPSGIRVESISAPMIQVTGVGESDNTNVTVRLVDESGSPVPDPAYRNLKVSFLARPAGGEILSGWSGRTVFVSSPTEIMLATKDGEANFNLQAGTLPGAVELKLEVLDEGETPLVPSIATLVPQISIASGPPHTIALSAPSQDAIVDLNPSGDPPLGQAPGFYSRRAGLIVTDRYGNAVPDGTLINLGIVDSVIAAGTAGATAANDDTFIHGDPGVNLLQDYILRNGVRRYIEPNDRLVIFNVPADDKSRFVSGDIQPTTMTVSKPFQNTAPSAAGELPFIEAPAYAVGASLLGASVYGINETIDAQGQSLFTASKGTATTRDGLAQIRLVYPANANTIRIGKLLYPSGSYPAMPAPLSYDPRYDQAAPMSARIIFVATANDDRATLVDEGSLIFSSITPWELTASPTTISGDTTIELTLKDGGSGVALPLVPIRATVVNTTGNPVASVEQCVTDLEGKASVTIDVVNAPTPDDAATIVFTTEEASVSVALKIPK
jgi:hypothetical protein